MTNDASMFSNGVGCGVGSDGSGGGSGGGSSGVDDIVAEGFQGVLKQ